eukprot:CAMPEP_0194295132 /NCGR_PEP_ID=MMETSP0169-20130528/52663_1 /TAXON_ID=218684 /ORGANISM="Corethron pennatum, Strain L29A3" /LENGTH=105 /DNA_ID=CAMNT_0039044235 /DNA_START=154 /DNA_END=467 /DNA_ORIENTATION=-
MISMQVQLQDGHVGVEGYMGEEGVPPPYVGTEAQGGGGQNIGGDTAGEGAGTVVLAAAVLVAFFVCCSSCAVVAVDSTSLLLGAFFPQHTGRLVAVTFQCVAGPS